MTRETDAGAEGAAPEPDLDALAEAYNRGLEAERAGRRAEAVAAYREALALDPEDHGGVTVRLAAMGEAPSPEAAPPAYVATLFDQTAARFDDILVEQLGYAVPMMLRDLMAARAVPKVGRLLDLGCGTGLTGESLSQQADHVTGVDLSEGMVEIAWEKGGYDDLYVGEAVAFLEGWDEAPFDMIAATDVLPYLGPLEGLMAGAARCLSPGGLLAISTETLPADGFGAEGWCIGPRHRYAHAEAYVRSALSSAGFEVLAFEPITVRHEEGVPVPGHLVLARLA